MKFGNSILRAIFSVGVLVSSIVTSAQTNNFLDASPVAKTIQVNGNAQLLQGQSKFGGNVGSFDGNGDYLTVSPAPFSGNTPAVTIEAWIYLENVGANGWPIVSQTFNTSAGDQQFYVSGSNGGAVNQGKLRFTRGVDLAPAVDLIGVTVLPLNQWIHVAFSCDGVTARLFVNGGLEATTNLAIGWAATNHPFLVASAKNDAQLQNQSFAQGKVFDLRVTQNSARYKSAFIPFPAHPLATAAADDNWPNTLLMLRGEGSNDSTQTVDESAAPRVITFNGNARLSTSQKKFGSSSVYFDGSADFLSITGSDLSFGTGDFTIETWVYHTSPTLSAEIYESRNTDHTDNGFVFYVRANQKLTFGRGNPYVAKEGISMVPTNVWNHVALTRQNGIVRGFLNGVLEFSVEDTKNFTLTNARIGANFVSTTNSPTYMDNFRITKGVSLYSTNFSPSDFPSMPRAGDANWDKVSLLLSSNGIDISKSLIDGSYLTKSFTFAGDAKNSTSAKVVGESSLSFDGSGDYVTTPDNIDFRLDKDFTIEAWVKLNSTSGGRAIISTRRNANTINTPVGLFVTGGKIQLVGATASSGNYNVNLYGGSVLQSGQWYHVAAVRSGNTWSIYVNGKLDGSITSSIVPYAGSGTTNIGGDTNTNYFDGYINNLRLTKGVARYNEDFIPPSYELQPARYINDPYSDQVSLLLMSSVNAAASDYPHIVSTSKDVTIDLRVASILVNTSTVIDPATFTAHQVSLIDSAQNRYQVSVVKIAPTQYNIVPSSTLFGGSYTLKISNTLLTPTSLPLDQNKNGIGGESDDVYTETFVVERAAPNPVTATINPQGNGTGTSLGLDWQGYVTAANGNSVASFRIYTSLNSYTDIAQATLAAEVPATQTSTTLEGLLNNTTYYVSVVAVDSAGHYLTQVVPTAVKPLSTLEQSTSYTYYPSGLIKTEDGARTDVIDVTTYTYDTAGNRSSVTNALNQATSYTSYDAMGRLLSVTDTNGLITTFTYDDNGRLLTSRLKHPTNASLDAVTSYGYDAVGLMTSMTLPNQVKLEYEYDGARRLVAIKNANNERIEYQLDAAGNRTGESIKDSVGAIKYSVARAYDELSRVMTITGNHQQQDKFKYDVNDNQTEINNGLNHKTQQNFDALNRVAKVIDPNLGETKFTYDSQDRIQTVTDARGNTTTYNYDGLGNLLSQVSPDTGITTFSYDAAGNRTSAKDARGVVVNYTYDALNRLTQVKYPNSAENVTYTYDDNTNGNYGVGRLTAISSGAMSLTYKYNYQGLIIRKVATVNSIASSIDYAYDLAGNLTRIQYPSGRILTYVRDSLGRVASIKTKANDDAVEQTVLSGIGYLPFGPARQYTYGNGLSHTVSYDTDYRTTAIAVGGVLSRGYTYDVGDNITAISDGLNTTKSQTFTYDSLDRLESANGSYGYQIYSYDMVGNRTGLLFDTGSSLLSDTYNYEATSNRLSSVNKKLNGVDSGTRSFNYDNAGNRIVDTATAQSYLYNDANRLGSLTVNNTLAASYAYNPLGQRVLKTLADNSKEIYHYDEAGQLIAVANASGVMQREYIYNGSQLVGFVNNQAPITPILLAAASATFQGSHVLSKAQTGYTGATGFIDIVNEGQVNWSFNVVSTATYDIKVRYSLAAADRPLDVLIDGVKKGTLNFPATANWNTWTVATISLPFTSGNHTLSLKTTGKSGANIDKVDLMPATGQTSGPTLHYVHTDHLGTPQVVTAQNQSVIWMVDYQPFGQLKPSQTNTIELFSRFPGQYLDSESGLYYNYFRDYDPTIGRYIESDPIGLRGGVNTYAYVEGNPLGFTDRLGLQRAKSLGQALAAAFGLGGAGAVGTGASGNGGVGDSAAGDYNSPAGGYNSPSGNYSPVTPYGSSSTGFDNPWGGSSDKPKDCPPTDNTPEQCSEEVAHCEIVCERAGRDFQQPNVYGGSWNTCMSGCVSSRCKAELGVIY